MQQKHSYVMANGSPPTKRQRLLGVNKNNEVIILEDEHSEPSVSSRPNQPLSPTRNRHAVSFSGTLCKSQVAVPANSCIVGTDTTRLKTATAQQQTCSKPAPLADDVICIDDDEDDESSLAANESQKADSWASAQPISDKSVEPEFRIPNAQKASTDTIVHRTADSVISSSADVHGVETSNGDCAAACINLDETFNSKQCHLTSRQVADGCLSESCSVDGQQQQTASATGSPRHSSLDRRVAKLENLLEVSVHLQHLILFDCCLCLSAIAQSFKSYKWG